MAAPCKPALGSIPGTGFNQVTVPDQAGSSYNNAADQLLYEIWQTLLTLSPTPPVMHLPIFFTIGDGKPGTPVAGTTVYSTALLANLQAIVFRNAILMQYSDGVTTLQINRDNTGAVGGFTIEPSSGITFQPGENWQIFIIGSNTTIE